ncbi:hypothetical protein NDU88_000338 [Pleurodeles waltl]|uniref:Uncharacterized protein n=1 Tax=Pleurodeles waltl TaxID=8319 RepID=A0AAV7URJ3_PLEWA|nr:hypothetical protein NDU88_000338 [Pleurodeles waltl]
MPRGGPRLVPTPAEPAAVRGRWCGAGNGRWLSGLTLGCAALVMGYSLGPFASTEADQRHGSDAAGDEAPAGFDVVREDGRAQFAGLGARPCPSSGMPDRCRLALNPTGK